MASAPPSLLRGNLTSTVTGLAGACGLMVFVFGTAGETAAYYWDPGSIVIVLGGTLAATILSYRTGQFWTGLRSLGTLFRDEPPLEPDVQQLVQVVRLSGQHKVKDAEEAIARIDNPFLRLGLQLALDHTPVEEIQHMMSFRIDKLIERETADSRVFRTMAEFAPAFGMFGTLVGLVGMLSELGSGDLLSIGQNMAVALVTTVYGVILSNLVFKPIANKLEQRMLLRVAMLNVLLDGILLMRLGRNAGTIEDALATLLRTYQDEIRGGASLAAGGRA